ncbi:unnamed protein product [Cylicocyclus nassatus]|uniref:SCP domain-containing protein n=1 Tax=Cylicocyclus nassatus TaxID=53992 RepID=A0AA36MA11_CYLNA|nr:unnamed protein product [Cylicocyclus nassatus]
MLANPALLLLAVLVPSVAPAVLCGNAGGVLDETVINEEILKPLNAERSRVVRGKVASLPAGKKMNKIRWSCNLENAAKAALDATTCAKSPQSDVNSAGVYLTHDADNATIKTMMDSMLSNIDVWADANPSPFTSKNNKVASTSASGNADLIRGSMTKIGCAHTDCEDEDEITQRIFYCRTDQPPLKNGNTIYVTPDGGCKTNADCDAIKGEICDTNSGLCEMSSTTVPITSVTTSTTATTTTTPSYPGELPTGQNYECGNNVGMNDELRKRFLDMHNYRRSNLAQGMVQRPSGRYLPQGADMIKLRYNCDLEKDAIEEVRQCPTYKTGNVIYGKNFDSSPSTITSTFRSAVEKAVSNWWKIVRKDNQGPGMKVTFRQKHVGTPIESYTQVKTK